MVIDGTFRQDLYQRINILNIELPPLIDRREDIPPLVEYFLNHFGEERKQEPKIITNELMQKLMEYDWPGNIRELENSLLRAVELAPGNYLRDEDFDLFANDSEKPDTSLKAALKRFEREYIIQQLAIHQWNVIETAGALGIDRTNLFRKVKAHNVPTKRRREEN